MAKRHPLKTRAFGAEPSLPDIAGLAGWIAEHRGRFADITTYLLDRSLAPQVAAGIGQPCAGGVFYSARLRQCLQGLDGDSIVEEIHADTLPVIEDAAGIVVQKKGAWCAMPAPRALGMTDAFYHDEDERDTALHGAYRTIMRSMRDTGVEGHVLVADRAAAEEIASLGRQKVFFFLPSPEREDYEALLEYQRQVAVPPHQLETVIDLMNEFQVSRIFLLDPDPQAVQLALAHFDPDQVTAGGYYTNAGDDYWTGLVSAAFYGR